jgi:Cation/multidrug efflux pump
VFSLNNKPATGIGVFQSPGANALEVEKAVKDKMAVLAKLSRRTSEIRHAVRHHQIRLGIDQRGLQDADRGRPAGAGRDPGLPAGLARDAGAGDHRAGHHHRRLRGDGALGFTVNISTLFAIVLAIGIVVDDAIVVVEGAGAQYREGHVRP